MLLLLLACASSPDDTGPGDTAAGDTQDFSPPDDVGPWQAGTFESVLHSTTGLDLTVQVWYPTADTSGTTASYDDLLAGTALEGAAPDCGATRPVMMFSHGSGGVRYQSIFWTEYLATHGWVVVAPDHTFNTFFDDDSTRLMELALRRPVDIRDSFDWLVDTEGDGLLAGCVDPDGGFDMSGHSFGAYTTLIVTGTVIDIAASLAQCEERPDWLCDEVQGYAAKNPGVATIDLTDPRARTGIPMSPAGYELLVGGLSANTTPMLAWVGTRDELTPLETQVRPIYDDLGSVPADLGVLTDAGHYTFSDACELAPIFDDCAAPYLDPAVAHPIIRTVSLAFLQDLAGSPDAAAWLPPEEPLLTWESR